MTRHLIAFFLLLSSVTSWASPRIKTGQEFFNGLKVSTNQLPNQSTLQYYLERASAFPVRGDFGELSRSSLSVMLSLASLFCEQLVNADARQADPGKRWAYGSVDFTRVSSTALVPSVQDELVNTYASLFWLRSPDSSERMLMLEHFAQQIGAGVDLKTILASTCALAATSFQGLVVP